MPRIHGLKARRRRRATCRQEEAGAQQTAEWGERVKRVGGRDGIRETIKQKPSCVGFSRFLQRQARNQGTGEPPRRKCLMLLLSLHGRETGQLTCRLAQVLPPPLSCFTLEACVCVHATQQVSASTPRTNNETVEPTTLAIFLSRVQCWECLQPTALELKTHAYAMTRE